MDDPDERVSSECNDAQTTMEDDNGRRQRAPHNPQINLQQVQIHRRVLIIATGYHFSNETTPVQASTPCQDNDNLSKESSKTAGTREYPIDSFNVNVHKQSEKKNIPWINPLHLTFEDKHLIERGHWLYNKIINAAAAVI